jgi:phosphoglycolate phosphatase
MPRPVWGSKKCSPLVSTASSRRSPGDAVVRGLVGAEKGAALREQGARAYIGDHTGDVDAARAAEIVAVAVATGAFDSAALTAYGADVVLPDLLAFPEWLGGFRAA